jgi:FrmR/RcnR family transcriptional regulator, repressor of rcnA expression
MRNALRRHSTVSARHTILPHTVWYTPVPYAVPEPSVSHVIRKKSKLLNRVQRVRERVEAAERALEQEIGCADIMPVIAVARVAINGLMAEVTEVHIRVPVDPRRRPSSERAQATAESIDVARASLE